MTQFLSQDGYGISFVGFLLLQASSARHLQCLAYPNRREGGGAEIVTFINYD